MTLTYAEMIEQDFQRQIRFTHIKDYHDLGYKGQGWAILNAEVNDDHMLMTNKVIQAFAPEAILINGIIGGRTSGDKIISSYIIINGVQYEFEEAIDKFNIKVITRSYSGPASTARLAYFRDIQKRKGVIFVCSAGNEPDEMGCYAPDNTAITVSASKLYEDGTVKIRYYGELGEIDFSFFMARGVGTSASAPGLASFILLLLNRYGDFNQEECVEILKSLSIDLGVEGYDLYYGWGLPILPLTDKLEILEKLRGEKVADFKDIEQDRWSKPAIDRCVAEGLLLGYEDGTFRPTENVTREQFATILTRILDKIEGRI